MKEKKNLPQESLVRIFVNGDFCSSLLCTPRDIKELTVGWLYNEGYIQKINEISALVACDEMQDIHVQLTNGQHTDKTRKQVIRTSACMGGEMSYGQFFRNTRPVNGGPEVSLMTLKSLMKRTLALATFYKETGGIHCAGIASADDERLLSVFEDVGRHNAFDKAIGRVLIARTPQADNIFLTSGRISSEMALKAAHSMIPVVASITTCTDLAIRIADAAGLTVVGRVLSATPVVLCGEKRVVRGGE